MRRLDQPLSLHELHDVTVSVLLPTATGIGSWRFAGERGSSSLPLQSLTVKRCSGNPPQHLLNSFSVDDDWFDRNIVIH